MRSRTSSWWPLAAAICSAVKPWSSAASTYKTYTHRVNSQLIHSKSVVYINLPRSRAIWDSWGSLGRLSENTVCWLLVPNLKSKTLFMTAIQQSTHNTHCKPPKSLISLDGIAWDGNGSSNQNHRMLCGLLSDGNNKSMSLAFHTIPFDHRKSNSIIIASQLLL